MILKLKKAMEFAKENGYLLAVYKKEGDNYKLYDNCHTVDIVDKDRLITAKTVGTGIDFKEFITEDKEFCFRLHNNFNLPDVIPIIKNN